MRHVSEAVPIGSYQERRRFLPVATHQYPVPNHREALSTDRREGIFFITKDVSTP
jgi:hypothetical protein